MELKEALDYLKTRGFITEDTDTLQDEFDSLDKNHSFPSKHEMDTFVKLHKGSLKNKIANAKSFNLMSNLKTLEKEMLDKLEDMGLVVTGSHKANDNKQLTEYDVKIEYKGDSEEGFVCLYVDDGELWVNYELFSGTSGNDPYDEFMEDTAPWEIEYFKDNVQRHEEEAEGEEYE